MADVPQITFDRSKRRGKLRDAYSALAGQWFVSDRLKKLLEQTDPQAFVFIATEVDYSMFEEPGPAYWFCDLVRQLDCIDDEKSKFTLYDEVDFKAYKALIDIKMRADVVGNAHAFRLLHQSMTQIVDDVFVQTMNAAKIRGFRFTAIQQMQDVLAESRILQALIDANKFNIDAANNILFLPRNFDLADATGTARHAGNHAPVGEAQKALLDAFDKTPTPSGKTYGDLLQADPQTLTAAENTLRTQIMDKAESRKGSGLEI